MSVSGLGRFGTFGRFGELGRRRQAAFKRLSRRHSVRRARKLLLSPLLWRRRLVFWFGAILVGVVAALFAQGTDQVQLFFTRLVAVNPLIPLAMTPAIFAACAWMSRVYFPSAPGSGIPQAIAAREVDSPAARRWLLGMKPALGKMGLTALALLGGASVGREGPTVQIGAGILLACAAAGRVKAERDVILAGAAAGVAAAFNTPLAGIVFAIEELARGFHHRNTAVVLTAIVLAGAASMSIIGKGNYAYFGHADAGFTFRDDWLPVLAIGAGGGLAGSAFARLLIATRHWLRTPRARLFQQHYVLYAAGCGLLIALLGLASHGMTYGTGYHVARDILYGQTQVSWVFTAAKFAAVVLSNICGIPGGIFSPSLSVGAALGSAMAPWFPHAPLQGVILLGMVAYFTGVTQAPITAFVIVLEITGNGVIPAPLIAAAVIAAGTARILCPESLYHVMAKGYMRQALQATRPQPPAIPDEAKAETVQAIAVIAAEAKSGAKSGSAKNPGDKKPLVIALDGTAASGKGTLGRALAAAYDLAHLDTGALYRLTALHMLEAGAPSDDEAAATEAAVKLRAGFDPADTADPDLRSEKVSQLTSKISAIPAVRDALLGLQRDFAANPPPLDDGRAAKGAVLDGRDIGTVVCPDATVKLYIVADVAVRAQRRFAELEKRGVTTSYDAVLADMQDRDARDAGRAISPMQPAVDAVILDTTQLDAAQAVAAAQAAVATKLRSVDATA